MEREEWICRHFKENSGDISHGIFLKKTLEKFNDFLEKYLENQILLRWNGRWESGGSSWGIPHVIDSKISLAFLRIFFRDLFKRFPKISTGILMKVHPQIPSGIYSKIPAEIYFEIALRRYFHFQRLL